MTRLNIIVRFKDEATYLEAVLRAIREQRCDHQVEIVAIDNSSTDNSAKIAASYADLLLDISEYRPGAALNQAISSCNGDALVILSAHAIPADRSWLETLTAWLPNQDVLGTYGAQLYPVTSRFLDKRDLDIFSGLRPRTETRDSDFWNANSAFQRSFWEKEQFDSSVIELEDHHWTKKLLPQGSTWVRFERRPSSTTTATKHVTTAPTSRRHRYPMRSRSRPPSRSWNPRTSSGPRSCRPG